MLTAPLQTTLDLGVALAEVTFCVVDLETTGGSPVDSRITEIGAVRVRGGERLGTFASLVNPQQTIPRPISHLTGIDDVLVAGEPTIDAVLPSFVEFARGSVIVAHNARFDFTFLNAALERLEYPRLPGPPVCTARLARRIVWPEVPNVRLLTLSRYFRTRAEPVHRALADAETCAEVLDGLLDLGGRLGIATLGDLHEVVRARGRPHFGKIAMAEALPERPGVYVFRARDGRTLYVGKSKALRSRVRSYFYGDGRKQVDDLLAEVAAVEGIETPGGELEALVLEARLIREREPKYNRRGKTWRRGAYLRLDTGEAFPRIKVVHRATARDGSVFVGPFGSSARARLAKEALEEFVHLRRCTRAMRPSTRFAACALADIGKCPAPCDGRIDPERYGELVRRLVSSLDSPGGLLAALERRMRHLAERERFEEAADVRDRIRSITEALARRRQDAWLVGAGRLTIRDAEGRLLRFRDGALETEQGAADAIGLPCPRERSDELAAVRSWLQRNAVTVEACDRPPAEPVEGGAALARMQRLANAADAGDNIRPLQHRRG